MEILTHEVTLGFSNETGILNIPISQRDVNRIISIGFTDYGEDYEIPENTIVFLKAKKPDGTEINTDEFCSVVDNKVQLQIFEQLSIVNGTVQCEIILSDENGTHYTSNQFNLIVNKSVHNDENLRSSNTYKNLTDILLELKDTREYLDTNENARILSENTRISNENARILSETQRESNEDIRGDNETQRQTDFNAKIHALNDAIALCNTAIANVNQTVADFNNDINDIVCNIIDEAEGFSNFSKSYAIGTDGEIRVGDESDNSKYYYEKVKSIAQGISGALIPMGTVSFSNLPALSDAESGWMYNISDQFTTTSDFNEGSGNVIPIGANVYKTTDGKWDVLAGAPVTSVNGQTGSVNITAESIGALPKDGNAVSATKATKDINGDNIVSTYLKKTGDASNTTVTFELAAERAGVQSGDDLATAFSKLSKYCADLKTVAFSGSYTDLDNTPDLSQYAKVSSLSYTDMNVGVSREITSLRTDINYFYPQGNNKEEVENVFSLRDAIDQSTNKISEEVVKKADKSSLHKVATTGKYSDLSDRITLTNTLMANAPGTGLDAVQGKVLNDKIDTNTYLLSGGNSIPNNTDLNNILDIGSYYCENIYKTATLTNCPTTSAFTMKVEHSTGVSYVCQTIRDFANGDEYYRFKNENKWEQWHKTSVDLENRVNQINSDLVFKKITIPNPVVVENTYTYNIDLSPYKELSITILLEKWGSIDTRVVKMHTGNQNRYYVSVISVAGEEMALTVSFTMTYITIEVQKSSFPSINVPLIYALYGR